MKVRLTVSHIARTSLRWFSLASTTAGLAGLAIVGWRELDARFYQQSQHVLFARYIPPPPFEASTPGPATAIARRIVRRLPAAPDPHLIGRLEIPRLRISVLIREGIDSQTLRRAVGRVPGTGAPGKPGNFVVAGHRDTFFRDLRFVKRGDEIRIVTPAATFLYRVDDLRVVGPEDIEPLRPTVLSSCTLVTCFPFSFVGNAPRRFVVRAVQSAT